jgi:TRAP transporter 4TM/12TM fusion protein
MDEEPKESKPMVSRILRVILQIVAIAMAFYQLAFTQYLIQDPVGHRITHLGFALAVILLAFMIESKKRKGWLLGLGLFLSSLLITGYLMILLEEILTYRPTMPIASDLIIAVLLIVVVFITTYLVYGKTFPVLAALCIIYLYFGRYLPYPYTVADVPVDRIIMWLGASLGTEEGIYGDILAISSNYLFLFIFFGSMLEVFGGTRFILGIGNWIGSKLRSGPAAMPVFSDIFLGEVTGSTVASIVITGSFTIPLMKKAGYTPAQAAAIETVTSNGGQIMPPVMGATAFVMAGFAGIPYVEIAKAAIVPAFLYYFGAFIYVQLTASKIKLISVLEPLSSRKLLLDAPVFFIPLGVMVYLLVKGFTLPYIVFWSVMAIFIMGLLSSVRKEARLSFKQIIEGLTKGAITASEMAVICGLIGVVATCIKVSGLGIKLPLMIGDTSHGSIFIALMIAMVASILLGMGVPTPVAYILVAIGAVPALRSMGVDPLPAHFFCFLFAIYSHFTPPVAIGALVASQIAGAKYWSTGWESIKAAATAFILPFFLIYVPVIILRPDGDLFTSITQIVTILIIISSTQMFFSNYCFTILTKPERFTFLATSILCLIGIFNKINPIIFAGIVLFVISIAWQFIRYRNLKATMRLS